MAFLPSCRRVGRIVYVIARHALAHSLSQHLVRWPQLVRRLGLSNLSGPERLCRAIEELGGTFIKFGQILALQPDILSLEYCNALFNLLDRVAPFGFKEVERIFVEDLGTTPMAIFDSFDHQPIAAGSIGQVHVAYLGARKLAVKVQRPSVERDFAGDIRLMTTAIRVIRLTHLKRLHWMIEPMSEFIAWTREELDYRCEARFMAQLGVNAKENAFERVPKVLWKYTTRRILSVEFLEGLTVLDYIREFATGSPSHAQQRQVADFAPNEFARNIINNFLGDAFEHGMYHADLHPANLMILPASVVGYVDFGIAGVLSPYSRRHLVALTLAYTRGDLDRMCESLFKVSTVNADSDAATFRRGLKKLADEWYGTPGEGPRLRKSITLVMLDLLLLSRRTGIWPERDVIKYIRSAITVDGLIKRFAPRFDVGRHLEMTCERHLRWASLRAVFSLGTLVGWSSSGGHLLCDGALRAAGLLRRIATGELPARAAKGGADGASRDKIGARAVSMTVLVFVVELMMTSWGARAQYSPNLIAAGLFLAAAATAMLLRQSRSRRGPDWR